MAITKLFDRSKHVILKAVKLQLRIDNHNRTQFDTGIDIGKISNREGVKSVDG